MSKLWFLLALTTAGFQEPSSTTPNDQEALLRKAKLDAERHRQQAIHINELAGRIHSEADALALVEAIAQALPDLLPPGRNSQAILQRVARAEYLSVSDPNRAIPEQRVAGVWNRFVREIGAPEETIVTADEIHYLRDSLHASAEWMWTSMPAEQLWTVPQIYAVNSDGKPAEGCRAIEALRVLYELERMFSNVRLARERERKGVYLSDELKAIKDPPVTRLGVRGELRALDGGSIWPTRRAEMDYIERHGQESLNLFLVGLFDDLFPASE